MRNELRFLARIGKLGMLAWALALAACLVPSLAQEQKRQGPPHIPAAFDVPPVLDVISGRPTDHSITLLVRDGLASRDIEIVWSPEGKQASSRLGLHTDPGRSVEAVLAPLQPDAAYTYRILSRSTSEVILTGRFHTQRAPAQSFAVTVTADSHLDQHTSIALYRQTLNQARLVRPDFHIDLGDTFMTDKHADRAQALHQYEVQRHCLGELSREVPLFLVLGNHDGEDRKLQRGGKDGLAVWANEQRKRLFPNPVPDRFYQGNATMDPLAGQLQDYYAWEWGDALFVVLNPYWHAPNGRTDDGWNLSLGSTQYNWLKQVLQRSHAKYKLIFVHQLVGGMGRQGRGGVEAASFGEWGGKNADGTNGFDTHRPGWSDPIHALLVRHKVSAVFHGHDHLYAHQMLDGIVYQEVPQPGHSGHAIPPFASEYGYTHGTILGDSGFMRLDFSPQALKVQLIATEFNPARALDEYVISPSKAD